MNTSNATVAENERWCTTPFATRTIRLKTLDHYFFVTFDLLAFFTNIAFACLTIHILKSTHRLRTKRCLWLIYHRSVNDIIFTIITQTLYMIKLLTPELRCYYDLVFTSISLSLADTSLFLEFSISLVRFYSTKTLMKLNYVLTRKRAWYVVCAAFTFAAIITLLNLLGSYVDNVFLIHLPTAISCIVIPVTIPIIYQKAANVARRRRLTSYFHKNKSFVERTLHRAMFITLMTYIPFRWPFFVSSLFKMIYLNELDYDSSRRLQFIHSMCFLLFCLGPVGNAMLYFLSDKRARRRINAITYDQKIWFVQLVRRLNFHQRAQVASHHASVNDL